MKELFKMVFLAPDGTEGGSPQESSPQEASQEPSQEPSQEASQETIPEQKVEAKTEQTVEQTDPPDPRPKWKFQCKKERQDDAFLDQFPTVDDLALYAINKAGASGVPGEDSSDVEKAEFYKAIGVPEKPEEYQLELDEEVLLPQVKEFFENTFHEAKLSTKQADTVAKAYQEFIADQNQKLALERAESFSTLQKDLKKKYGQDLPAKVDGFAKALSAFGGEDFKNLMKMYNLDNHPVISEFLIKAGETLAEHPLHGVNSSQEAPRGGAEGQVLTYGEQFRKFAEG